MPTPAERIALWAEKLRDLSASGLAHAENVYDLERYKVIQDLAVEMTATATGGSVEALEPLRATLFSRPSPLVAGAGAVINADGEILLQRRADNNLWNMPGGLLEVGETPAAGVVREVFEETGVRCEAVALSGVYDSRVWGSLKAQHLYKFTFLCRPLKGAPVEAPSHAVETLEAAWFPEAGLPEGLWEGHAQRIRDAYGVFHGDAKSYFDV